MSQSKSRIIPHRVTAPMFATTATAPGREPLDRAAASRREHGLRPALGRLASSTALLRLARLGLLAMVGPLPLGSPAHAQSLPTGGEVAAGTAGISSAPGALTITQTTRNAAINWQSFGIAAGNSVTFVQPDAGSVALNRVIGSDPSVILGNLAANGKVFLVNPNGILFGRGAQVNVGGMVASTLDLSDADFMADRYSFAGTSRAGVLNLGAINADRGYVALLGANVSNEGVIQANLGTVALAAGEAITLDVVGDNLLNVTVDRGAVGALIRNGGLLRANGGQVVMTALAAGQLLKTAVNNEGVVEARTIENRSGTIKLLGDMHSGTLDVDGLLDASAPDGGDGGFVETSAAIVNMVDGARVTTLAAAGRTGTWLTDPTDYVIATSGGNETPTNVTLSLASSNRLIEADHDITVADAVTWTTPQMLELRAGNDVLINAEMTASTGGSRMRFAAGHDVVISGALTASALGSLIDVNAGHDIRLEATVTATAGGGVVLRADSDGTGGLDGGTVSLGVLPVTADTKTIYYSPENGYASPNDYAGFTSHMWVFVAANDKTYDGTVAATARFRGDPTVNGVKDVELTGGTIALTDQNAGAAKPATFGGYGLTGSNAALYALFAAAGTTTATIAPAPLTLTANSASKTYGQSLSFLGTAFTTSGLVNGETISSVTATSPGAVATAGVAGSPYVVTPGNATGGTFNAANYAITYGNGALTVTPASLVIKANDAAKSYGDTASFLTTAFTSTGLQNGETIGGVAEASLGAAATAIVAGTPYAITASGAVGGTFDAGNYTISYADGALAVGPAVLTLTANDVAKTYGQAVTLSNSTFVATGLKNGDTVGGVTQASLGAAATAGVAGSPYAITASGATGGTFVAANYAITYANGALTIAPAALSITASSAAKTYGQAIVLPGTAFTSIGLRNGDAIDSVSLSSAGIVATAGVGSAPYAITASSAAGSSFVATNYTTTYVDGALSVGPAGLLITASNASKTYGDTLTFAGTEFVTTGIQNGESIGSVAQASAGAVATAAVVGSPYAITASGATGGTFTAANYAITYANGALTVDPAALSVTASGAAKTYGQAIVLPATAFTSIGLRNGDAIDGVSLSSAGVGATAGVGSAPYAITASSAAGSSFVATNYTTTYVDGALSVAPAALLVTASDASKTYGNTLAFAGTEFVAGGLKNGETVGTVTHASTGAVATAGVAGAPYAITASSATGGTFTATNYAITYANGALTVDPAALSVTASGAAKTYGQTIVLPGTAFTSIGLRNGDAIDSVSLSSAGAGATAGVLGAPYAITASDAAGGSFTATNYVTTYVDGAFTVTPAALLIAANDATKTYGTTLSFAGTEFAATGLKNGETIGTVTEASPGTAATAAVLGSPYTISVGGAVGGTFTATNYAISYAGGALTVTSAPLRVTANGAAKTYGQAAALPATAFGSVGLQNGETIDTVSLSSQGAVATAPVGGAPYAIAPSTAIGSGFTASNYAITYVDGILTVAPAPLLVTAGDASKIYGDAFAFDPAAFTTAGLQNGETIGAITQASVGAPATASVAGGAYAINASAAAGGTFDAGNYAITYRDGILAVIPAILAVTANNATKSYGDVRAFDGTEFSAIGLRNGDAIDTLTLASAGAAASAGVGAGPYGIAATNAVGVHYDAANYDTTYAAGLLDVLPIALLVTADSAIKTYGDPLGFDGTAFTATGLRNGETIGRITATSQGAAATANVTGSPYAIVASDAAGGTFGAANYLLSYADGALDVAPAPLTVTASDASKVYGQTLTLPPAAFTAVGLRNGDRVDGVNETSAGVATTAGVVGGPYAITPSGAAGSGFVSANYTIAYRDGSLAVTPAALLVTANDAGKTQGDSLVLSGSGFFSAGLQNDDAIDLVTQTSPGTDESAKVEGGPYSITASNARGVSFDAANYAITYVAGALTVDPAPLPPLIAPIVTPSTPPPVVDPPIVFTPVVADVPPVAQPQSQPGVMPVTTPEVGPSATLSTALDATLAGQPAYGALNEPALRRTTGLSIAAALDVAVIGTGVRSIDGRATPTPQPAPANQIIAPSGATPPPRLHEALPIYAPKQDRN